MDIEPSKRGISPKTLTYQNLLSGMKRPESSSFTINELKTELYRRIKNKLYQKCERLCKKNRIDDPTPIELMQDVVVKGFHKISNFEFGISWDEVKCENKIAAWFNVLASNHFIDLLKEKAKNSTDEYEDYEIEDHSQRPDEFEFETDDTTELRLQDAMDSLNDRERYIINICLKHNCLGNNDHLPDEVIEEICCSLGIKKGHERVIKFRALGKLRAKLLKN